VTAAITLAWLNGMTLDELKESYDWAIHEVGVQRRRAEAAEAAVDELSKVVRDLVARHIAASVAEWEAE
jgi:hypothetical protein